jgi:Mrp family chromosome partitioning ATPase
MKTSSLRNRLRDIRREFDYSIVVGSATEESDDAMAMAQFADGMILVLSAEHTRRITARKIREAMDAAQIRLLGTVLSDREFPVPAGIYRRL